MMNESMIDGYGMFFGGFIMLIIWGFAFFLVYLLYKKLFIKEQKDVMLSAKEILKMRLVNGDITSEQYDDMNKSIENNEK